MDLQLGRAVSIVLKTMPYVFYRACVYGILMMVIAVLLGVLAFIGWIFGSAAAVVILVIALAAGGFGMRLLREYVLYLLRAGHVAVITEIIERGSLPAGVSQTQWGQQQVTKYFKEVSVLALIDQLIKGIIGMVNRTLLGVMNLLPIPAMQGAAKVVQRIVDLSLTYIDESILAHTFRTQNENVYDAAKTGIVLYCQSWKSLIKNAVALTLLGYLLTFASALLFLIPLGAIAWFLPQDWAVGKFALFALALLMGFSLKWIFFDPIACAATILTFLRESQDKVPDPKWEAQIEAVSDKFRDLKDKAAKHWKGTDAPPPTTSEV